MVLFVPRERRRVQTISLTLNPKKKKPFGSWLADSTPGNLELMGDAGMFANATWSFTHTITSEAINLIAGCERVLDGPLYLQSVPLYTHLFLAPAFSVAVSLLLQQPWKTKELFFQTLFSTIAYWVNVFTNRHLFHRQDTVSAAGAAVIGFLGILYQKKFGGTGVTIMIPGVLFMIPVSIGFAPSGRGRHLCFLKGRTLFVWRAHIRCDWAVYWVEDHHRHCWG